MGVGSVGFTDRMAPPPDPVVDGESERQSLSAEIHGRTPPDESGDREIRTVALVVQAYTQTGLARQISLGCLAVLIRLTLEVTKRYRRGQIYE